eukprot:552102-Rhodomonas_salina.3
MIDDGVDGPLPNLKSQCSGCRASHHLHIVEEGVCRVLMLMCASGGSITNARSAIKVSGSIMMDAMTFFRVVASLKLTDHLRSTLENQR